MDEAVGVPVACLLTAPELRVRRQSVLAAFRAAQLEARELTDAGGEGYAFRFAPSAYQLAALIELIELERQCCPFLRFQLTLEPAGGALWLALTGPTGTREFLTQELGLVGASPCHD
jgi:hypothetical protein